mmetsp:Transcript_29765/g.64403  ORF Transcript_29765/g.64403 Transcript_29765/m.64403 type:complete len:596 (-) Transcript_29765:63-1850(-)
MTAAATAEMVTVVVKAGTAVSGAGPETAQVELPRAWLTQPIAEVFQIAFYPSATPAAQSAVQGCYKEISSKWSRKIYMRKRDASQPTWQNMFLYYWEDIKSQAYTGWYLSPQMDGWGKTYGFNPSSSIEVPWTGWRLSVRGEVDNTLVISEAPEEVKKNFCNSFFEAKLERWQDKDANPPVTLEIPAECNVAEGARLLFERFQSKFAPSEVAEKIRDPRSKHNGVSWKPLQWWRATRGRLTSLSAALHIFHLTMLEDWAREVAVTLERYRLRSSESTLAIAADLQVKGLPSIPALVPLKVQQPLLKTIIQDACSTVLDHGKHCAPGATVIQCEKCEAAKRLADRAIVTASPSSDLVKLLVESFFNCFILEVPARIIPYSTNIYWSRPRLGDPKLHAPDEWLSGHLEDLVRRRSDMFTNICSEIREKLPFRQEVMLEQVFTATGDVQASSEPLELSFAFRSAVCGTLSRCLSVLLVKSALTPERSDEVSSVIHATVPQTFVLHFRYTDCDMVGVYPGALAVASRSVQIAFLQSLPSKGFKTLRGYVHLVHEDALHFFLGKSSILSTDDVAFLSEAKFTGLESVPPTGEPKAKRLRM